MLSSLFDVVVVSREGEGVIILFLRPFPAVGLLKKRPKFFACGAPKKLSLQVECRSVPITVTSPVCVCKAAEKKNSAAAQRIPRRCGAGNPAAVGRGGGAPRRCRCICAGTPYILDIQNVRFTKTEWQTESSIFFIAPTTLSNACRDRAQAF